MYEEKGETLSSDIVATISNTLRVSSELAMSGISNNLADSLLIYKEERKKFKAEKNAEY